MNLINPQVVNGYYRITVADHGLSRLIRFVSQFTTQLYKKFCKHNIFYLILLNSKVFFDVMGVKVLALKILPPVTSKKILLFRNIK